MSDTPETDAARMEGYGEFSGDWCALERHDYKKSPEGEVVFAEVAEKLERERDEARKERDEAMQERYEAVKMLGERLYQRASEWTEELERLLGELNAAREEVSALKAKLKEEA